MNLPMCYNKSSRKPLCSLFFVYFFCPSASAEPAGEGELFVSSLKSMLTTHLENFGQVNDGILGLWAGPEHWRKKAKRRKLDEFGSKSS